MKTKVTIKNSKEESRTFTMSEMNPGQICIIDDLECPYNGHYVMRTLFEGIDGFEVIDITMFNDKNEFEFAYWIYNETSGIMVKQAPIGTQVILEVQ